MKQKIGNQNVLYPTSVTVVAALVNGAVNFINVAHVGILNAQAPHLISLGMNKSHHTNIGIRENRIFGVNIFSVDKWRKWTTWGSYREAGRTSQRSLNLPWRARDRAHHH